MIRRLIVVLIVLALACLPALRPAEANGSNLTPVPLSDTVVSGFLYDGFGWEPVSNLGESLAGSVSGGGAYSPSGDVVGFLGNNQGYLNAFPPLQLFIDLASYLNVNGQFVGCLFAKSPLDSNLANLLSGENAINFNWQWSNLALQKIISVDSSITTGDLGQLSLAAESKLDRSAELEGVISFNTNGFVLGLPIGLDESETSIYWLFGILTNDISNFTHPFSTEDLAFFISSAEDPQGRLTASAVPLPGAFWLFGPGLLGLAALGRRLKGRR
jgi:hypothetical protein